MVAYVVLHHIHYDILVQDNNHIYYKLQYTLSDKFNKIKLLIYIAQHMYSYSATIGRHSHLFNTTFIKNKFVLAYDYS